MAFLLVSLRKQKPGQPQIVILAGLSLLLAAYAWDFVYYYEYFIILPLPLLQPMILVFSLFLLDAAMLHAMQAMAKAHERQHRAVAENEMLTEMNRQAAEQSKTLKRGPLLLDIVTLRAFLYGEDMLLSAREFSVLLFLLKHEGKTLSAEEIYKGAWDQTMAGNASALWKCISRLKNKLAACGGKVTLMNFRNKGYLLEIIDSES